MTEGTVKWFDEKKGYGFITYHEKEEIFIHFTGIHGDGFRSLKTNQPVSFEIREGRRGLQATNLHIIEKE